MRPEHVVLHFKQGSSDKVYQAELVRAPDNSGWLVNFAYGRTGGTLKPGTKTKTPVTYIKAKRAYDILVRSKMSKGYKPKDKASAIQLTEVRTPEDTGNIPQLLNPIEEYEVGPYIKDPEYCMQEKFDGENRTIERRIVAGSVEVIGGNKKGQLVPLRGSFAEAVRNMEGQFVINGEDLGERMVVFDNIHKAVQGGSYVDRFTTLEDILPTVDTPFSMPETAWTPQDKLDMYNRLKAEGAEGVVFKKIDAPFTPGRPHSGGPQVKCKFYAEASCIVTGQHPTKSSVSVAVLDADENEVPVGNVTVYANKDMPNVGAIVEIKYLYWYPGGSLYQPIFKQIRTDVDREECVIGQLKAKKGL